MTESFTALGLPAALVARLTAQGITAPFPIQELVIPDVLAGRDVCGRAPTGSGKTLAFGTGIAIGALAGRARRPRALVLVPTRELASQVRKELAQIMPSGERSVLAVYGGVGYDAQRRALTRGVDTIVACPGRLEDLVARRDVVLADVRLVVVDEADRMADMGFLPSVRRLLDATHGDRQTLLFSATLDKDVAALVERYQRDPVHHSVADDDTDGAEVEHQFLETERPAKVRLTADLVGTHGRVVVFCRTRHGADRLSRQLKALGVDSVAIHGDRSQSQRESALAAFSAGRVRALIATDVAARGIHVDGVACVVHFDPPADAKDYIHRSGRTGRAGASGTVVSLVTPEDRSLVRTLQRALGVSDRIERPASAKPMAPAQVERPSVAERQGAAGPGQRSGPADPGQRAIRPVAKRALRLTSPARQSTPTRAARSSATPRSGTVRFFSAQKGYGFIEREDGEDLFVHFSNIRGSGYRSLDQGQRVAFEIVPGKRGHEAQDVRAV